MSRSFINFATVFSALALLSAISLILVSCEGRTEKNMVPSGDTIEVVIAKDTVAEFKNQIITE